MSSPVSSVFIRCPDPTSLGSPSPPQRHHDVGWQKDRGRNKWGARYQSPHLASLCQSTSTSALRQTPAPAARFLRKDHKRAAYGKNQLDLKERMMPPSSLVTSQSQHQEVLGKANLTKLRAHSTMLPCLHKSPFHREQVCTEISWEPLELLWNCIRAQVHSMERCKPEKSEALSWKGETSPTGWGFATLTHQEFSVSLQLFQQRAGMHAEELLTAWFAASTGGS